MLAARQGLRTAQRVALLRPALARRPHVPLAARTFASTSRRSTEVAPSPPAVPAATPLPPAEAVASTSAAVPLEAVDAVDVASSVVQLAQPWQIGQLHEAGLASYFTPAGWAQNLLEITGSLTGLPAWATIALVTVVGRTAILPLFIRTQKENVKMAKIQPRMAVVQAKMNEERANGTMTAMTNQRRMGEIQQLYKEADYSMGRAFAGPFSQMLWSASFFIGVRSMANLPAAQFGLGSGVLWFPTLSAVDPYYILPTMATASFMGMMQMAKSDTPPNEQYPNLMNGFTILTGASWFILAWLPSGLTGMMAVNGIFSMFQTLLLRVPAFRNAVGLAPLVKYKPRPFMQSMREWQRGLSSRWRSSVEEASRPKPRSRF